MDFLAQHLEKVYLQCTSKEDFLMVASLMMTQSRKIFEDAFGSRELANAFIIDYIDENGIDKSDLKKVV